MDKTKKKAEEIKPITLDQWIGNILSTLGEGQAFLLLKVEVGKVPRLISLSTSLDGMVVTESTKTANELKRYIG